MIAKGTDNAGGISAITTNQHFQLTKRDKNERLLIGYGHDLIKRCLIPAPAAAVSLELVRKSERLSLNVTVTEGLANQFSFKGTPISPKSTFCSRVGPTTLFDQTVGRRLTAKNKITIIMQF